MPVPALVVPPVAFGIVEEGIYRSNALTLANFPFIKQLSLRTVIRYCSLAPPRSLRR